MADPSGAIHFKKPAVSAYSHGTYLSENNVEKDKERINAQLAHAFNPTGKTLG